MTADRTRERLSLAVEHLQNTVEYARRGRAVFFNEKDPDTQRLIEGELRKAFESLNRQGDTFFHAHPDLDRARIGEVRQMLTHDYASVPLEVLWRMANEEAPQLLRRLARAKVPK